MNIGERIKDRRKALKMSADTLGQKLGKDRSTIYRYEKGEIENLPLDILEPIAEALSTTPAFLMGWEEEIIKKPAEMAEIHVEMIQDEDLMEMLPDFWKLDKKEKQIVKNLAHSLAEAKTEA